MAQNHNRLPAWRAILFRREGTPESGADAEYRKEVVGNKLSRNLLRFRSSNQAAQQKSFLGAGGQTGEDLRLLAEEEVIGKRETSIVFIRRPVFQPDYRIRGVDRQGAQLSVEKSKYGCVDPNAQGQSERNHEGEARLLPERTYCVAQVLPKVGDHIGPPVGSERHRLLPRRALDAPQFLPKRFALAQFRKRRAMSFIRRRAAGERLRVAILQMLS